MLATSASSVSKIILLWNDAYTTIWNKNSNAEKSYGELERMIRSSYVTAQNWHCSCGYNVVQLNLWRQFCWKKFHGILMSTVIYVASTVHFNYSSIPILPSPPNHTFQTNVSVSSQPQSLEWLCLPIQSDVLDILCQIHLQDRSPDIQDSVAYGQICVILPDIQCF